VGLVVFYCEFFGDHVVDSVGGDRKWPCFLVMASMGDMAFKCVRF
jgi:hypothetical protein